MKAYPEYFDPEWYYDGKTSNLTRAMDKARYMQAVIGLFFGYCFKVSAITLKYISGRGGRTKKVFNPRSKYPASAWYTYDDTTCKYWCQAIEYLWWGYLSYSGNSALNFRALVVSFTA